MNKDKRKALEAAGWVFGDAEDFLELNDAERNLVTMRLLLARGIRSLRTQRKLTQIELAKRMKTSQPRVVKIEAGSPDVSLEQLIYGYIELGGTMVIKLFGGECAAEVASERRPLVGQARIVGARPGKGVKAKKA
jgi:hypothetical protein